MNWLSKCICKIIAFVLFVFVCVPASGQVYKFPIHVSNNHRYLVDANGKPFLYVSDSGWLLFLGLNIDETREYFLKRKKQGFTAIHIMLTGGGPGEDCVNRQGNAPFTDNDFSQPNEAYFQYVDKVVELADSCNLLLSIVPVWVSCCDGGWGTNPANIIKKSGVEKCGNLGKYLGNRFKKFNNIFWIMGGDNDPGENRDELRSMATEIKKSSPNQLITYHAASTHSSTDVWDKEPWLDVSMTYTYFRGFHKAWTYMQPDIYEVNYTEYKKPVKMPFLLGESTYENEHTDVTQTVLQVRKQAYYSMLSGACGHSYGSPFYSVSIKSVNWRNDIDLPGANSMKYLNQLFATFQWQTLIPDTEGSLITSGNDKYATNDYAVTAFTADKKLSVTYIPSSREIKLDLKKLNGSMVNAKWFNPRNGNYLAIKTFPASSKPTLVTPDNGDWLLVLQALK